MVFFIFFRESFIFLAFLWNFFCAVFVLTLAKLPEGFYGNFSLSWTLTLISRKKSQKKNFFFSDSRCGFWNTKTCQLQKRFLSSPRIRPLIIKAKISDLLCKLLRNSTLLITLINIHHIFVTFFLVQNTKKRNSIINFVNFSDNFSQNVTWSNFLSAIFSLIKNETKRFIYLCDSIKTSLQDTITIFILM